MWAQRRVHTVKSKQVCTYLVHVCGVSCAAACEDEEGAPRAETHAHGVVEVRGGQSHRRWRAQSKVERVQEGNDRWVKKYLRAHTQTHEQVLQQV